MVTSCLSLLIKNCWQAPFNLSARTAGETWAQTSRWTCKKRRGEERRGEERRGEERRGEERRGEERRGEESCLDPTLPVQIIQRVLLTHANPLSPPQCWGLQQSRTSRHGNMHFTSQHHHHHQHHHHQWRLRDKGNMPLQLIWSLCGWGSCEWSKKEESGDDEA